MSNKAKTKIKTNNQPRLKLDFWELTDAERAEHDHDTAEYSSYVRYRGWVYSLEDFLQAPDDIHSMGWDGVYPETAFSAVLIRLCAGDPDHVIMGAAYD